MNRKEAEDYLKNSYKAVYQNERIIYHNNKEVPTKWARIALKDVEAIKTLYPNVGKIIENCLYLG